MELIFEAPGRNPNAVRMLCLFLHVGIFLPDLLPHEAITIAASRSAVLTSSNLQKGLPIQTRLQKRQL